MRNDHKLLGTDLDGLYPSPAVWFDEARSAFIEALGLVVLMDFQDELGEVVSFEAVKPIKRDSHRAWHIMTATGADVRMEIGRYVDSRPTAYDWEV